MIFAGAMAALEVLALGRATPVAALARLGKSPILWSIGLGIVLSLGGVAIPAPVQTFIDFNSAAAAPAALWALGVVLSGTSLRPDRTVVTFTAIKVVAFPMLLAAGLRRWRLGVPGDRFFSCRPPHQRCDGIQSGAALRHSDRSHRASHYLEQCLDAVHHGRAGVKVGARPPRPWHSISAFLRLLPDRDQQ